MRIDDIFKRFSQINDMFNDELIEISVKQHTISLMFNESMLSFYQLGVLFKSLPKDTVGFVTFFNEEIIVNIERLSTDILDNTNIFYPLVSLIEDFAKEICQCPSLEYSVSGQYMKCFLDKPGVRVSDLNKYEELLEAEGRGELEMHPQRAYFLFINENNIQ